MTENVEVELPYKTAKPAQMATCGSSNSNPAAASYSLAMGSLGMDKSTLKVHLPDGSFNVVRFGDATDIKVRICKKRPKIRTFLTNEMSFSRFAIWVALCLQSSRRESGEIATLTLRRQNESETWPKLLSNPK